MRAKVATSGSRPPGTLAAPAIVMLVASIVSQTAAGDQVLLADPPVDVAIVLPEQQQQFRGQFEPMLKVELSFANRVCKLSDDQRRELIAKSNAWLDEFAADYAKRGGQPQVVHVWFGVAGARGGSAEDPREAIQAGVKKLVKANVPKEQAALYEDESRKRSDFYQRVAAENIVAQMDKALKLAPEQRETLVQSLTKHWDKSWAPQLEMFMHGGVIWPNVPEQWIRPHLTANQLSAWNRLNKSSGHMHWGGGVVDMGGQVIDDIDLEEGKEQPPDAAEQQPAAVAEPQQRAVYGRQ